MKLDGLGRGGSVFVFLGWALFLALLAFGVYAVLARFVLHGPVTGDSLAEAVSRESESAGPTLDDLGRCRQSSDSIWRCSIVDRQGSGGALYRVSVEPDGSCWAGRLQDDHSEGGMPKNLDGCVYRWKWTFSSLL